MFNKFLTFGSPPGGIVIILYNNKFFFANENVNILVAYNTFMLKSLILQNFRSYRQKKLELSSGTTLIVGPNAIGKTNILEAIFCLALGKSFRAEEESEVIRNSDGESAGIAKILGKTESDELEIIWDHRERFSKLFRINGVGKRQVDFLGHLRAVGFSPTDIEIVTDSPAIRRKYLDSVLSQIDKDYRVAASVYGKAIRQRNRLLWRIREEQVPRSAYGEQLRYWDELLIEKGAVIHKQRRDFLNFLNDFKDKPMPVVVHYDHSIISGERLAKYTHEELSAATTLVGPHRDDFMIEVIDKKERRRNMKSFGSRGEQRLAVFTMKMAELEYIFLKTGQRPILLLDDIFSELDDGNRELVMETVKKQQTVMTTAEEEVVELLKGEEMEVVRLG